MKNKKINSIASFLLVLTLIFTSILSIQAQEDTNILIVYFSKTGNTLGMAEEIQRYTSGEIVEIVPLIAYPKNHEETVEIARRELDENYRPPLQTTITDIDQYDVIFLGYPIWW